MRLLTGNQAVALGALNAGVCVCAGYPGTPSTEVLETVSSQVRTWHKENKPGGAGEVHVEWSTNEKAALEVASGAAMSGRRAIMTCKMVGLNVASDPLMTMAYLGVNGGLVIYVADDPGPISSQTEQDTRQFAQFAHIPVIDPSTPKEAFYAVQTAFDVSESFHTPVILRTTTRICHSSEDFDDSEVGFAYTARTAPNDDCTSGFKRSPKWVTFPKLAYESHLAMPKRLNMLASYFDSDIFNTMHLRTGDADLPTVGIAASGVSYAYLMDALDALEADEVKLPNMRLYKVGTVFPFPEQMTQMFLAGIDEVLVFEELEPTLERALLQFSGAHQMQVHICGKLTGDTSVAGENSVELIAEQLLKWCDALRCLDASASTLRLDPQRFARHYAPRRPSDARTRGDDIQDSREVPPERVTPPARPPVLCAGCPHRASFAAVKKAMRAYDATFSGDIGCYTLGNAQPLDMVDTCVCMGAGFTVPQGMYWADKAATACGDADATNGKAKTKPKLRCGFVGDSTFFASGITGVINAVYNRAPVVLFVLDNSTTAMTGSQPHPGTGIRISYDASISDAENAISIPGILKACGVGHVTTCDPLDFSAAVAAAKEAAKYTSDNGAISAVVYKSPCITVCKAQPQPYVNDKCTQCRICIDMLGCPAITMGESAIDIDKSLCYGCDLCVQVCPSDAIKSTHICGAGDVADKAESGTPQCGDVR